MKEQPEGGWSGRSMKKELDSPSSRSATGTWHGALKLSNSIELNREGLFRSMLLAGTKIHLSAFFRRPTHFRWLRTA